MIRDIMPTSEILAIIGIVAVFGTPQASSQPSEWLGISSQGNRLRNLFRWNGSDSLWAYDTGFVRATEAPRSTIVDVTGGRLISTDHMAELRRPIECNVWIGVAVGGLVGALGDLSIMAGRNSRPEGYLPGMIGFTGVGLGALVALLYGTDEVYNLSEMDRDERALASAMRLPLAQSADRAGTVVTIENRSPRSRRISWTSWWLQGTFGVAGIAGRLFDPSWGMAVGYLNRDHIGVFDYSGWGRDDEFGNVAVHYGRQVDLPSGTLILSGGPGVLLTSDSPPLSGLNQNARPTVSMRASIFWPANGWLGMGVSAFAGGSDREVFGGIHLSYYLGDLD